VEPLAGAVRQGLGLIGLAAGIGARRAPILAALLAAGITLAAGPVPAQLVTVDREAIDSAVSHPERPAADRDRDRNSKPAEVLAFLGIAPGMRVLDMNAATGWYTELLARVVGPDGHVIAHNHPGARTTLAPQDFERRYGGHRLPNTEQLFVAHDGIALPAGSLDAVLMSMVYHDTYWYDPKVDWGPVDRHALLLSLYAALAPGGVIGVVDHYAAAGTDPRVSAKDTHRIDPAVVRADFAAAGFTLDGESDVLRNAADDRTTSVFDDAVRGRTDRFVLRFGRNANPSLWSPPR
jgi:predicted methyltransferase